MEHFTKSMEEFTKQLEHILLNGSLEFKPSQDKLSIPLIYRIYKKMNCGLINFDAIKIAEEIIMDGHHRYIAAKLSKTEIQIFPSTKNHSQQTFEWCDIILKTNEYDSESEIKYHNFNDALRNGISVDQIEKFLNN
jgi:hypothetical protein